MKRRYLRVIYRVNDQIVATHHVRWPYLTPRPSLQQLTEGYMETYPVKLLADDPNMTVLTYPEMRCMFVVFDRAARRYTVAGDLENAFKTIEYSAFGSPFGYLWFSEAEWSNLLEEARSGY